MVSDFVVLAHTHGNPENPNTFTITNPNLTPEYLDDTDTHSFMCESIWDHSQQQRGQHRDDLGRSGRYPRGHAVWHQGSCTAFHNGTNSCSMHYI